MSLADGSLLRTLETTVGSAGTPSGLAQVSGFVLSYKNQYSRADLRRRPAGQRLALRRVEQGPGAWTVEKFAELTSTDGTAQSVTVAPQIEVDFANGVDRYVMVGTGRLLHEDDLVTYGEQVQTMYVIRDGTVLKMNSAGLPHKPRSDADFSKLTDFIDGFSKLSVKGWYHDLPKGERIISPIAAELNLLGYAGSLPPENECLPGLGREHLRPRLPVRRKPARRQRRRPDVRVLLVRRARSAWSSSTSIGLRRTTAALKLGLVTLGGGRHDESTSTSPRPAGHRRPSDVLALARTLTRKRAVADRLSTTAGQASGRRRLRLPHRRRTMARPDAMTAHARCRRGGLSAAPSRRRPRCTALAIAALAAILAASGRVARSGACRHVPLTAVLVGDRLPPKPARLAVAAAAPATRPREPAPPIPAAPLARRRVRRRPGRRHPSTPPCPGTTGIGGYPRRPRLDAGVEIIEMRNLALLGEGIERRIQRGFDVEADLPMTLKSGSELGYPIDALDAGIEGRVLVWFAVDEAGKVVDREGLDGPQELRDWVLERLDQLIDKPARSKHDEGVRAWTALEVTFTREAAEDARNRLAAEAAAAGPRNAAGAR